MSASRILDRLSKKGQVAFSAPKSAPPNHQNGQSGKSDPHLYSLSKPAVSRGERVIDPVVARLKAARKAENELKERQLRERRGLPPKDGAQKQKNVSKPIPPRQPSNGGIARGGKSGEKVQKGAVSRPGANSRQKSVDSSDRVGRSGQNENKPKMSFSQLMAKASTIDTSKLSIALKQKTKSPEGTPPFAKRKSPEQRNAHTFKGAVSRTSQKVFPQKTRPNPEVRRPVSSGSTHVSSPVAQSRAPLPTRQPSSALQARLKQKPVSRSNSNLHHNGAEQYGEDEDEMESDLDSFIASEDEEELQNEVEYDRDEIWSIFNRGKKRSHYSYDDYESDDMEATGAEIFEEESRSKKNALLEDKRESEKEARLAAMKRARKLQRRD